ncbi:peptide deformylase [Patescibacteria group bacterium]|nr:peptide deformylase [Patescibacteria group bacterium]
MILPIITILNPILRQRAKELSLEEIKTPAIQKLIVDMKETVIPAGGVGLAAPQVGVSIRLVIIAIQDKKIALINPEIINFSWRKEIAEEGCLSVPGKWGAVKRSKTVSVKAQNENGEVIKFKARDLFARVIQHEIDHLNGVLFIDRSKRVIEEEAQKI